jgi:hypothetical protein
LKNLYPKRFAVGCEAVNIAASSRAWVKSSRVNPTLMIPDSDNGSNQKCGFVSFFGYHANPLDELCF